MNGATHRLPRVAVTGSAGVGKTTLGRALAEIFGVPLIGEGMRTRIEAGLDLHTLDGDGHRALLLELFDEALTDTRVAVDTAHGFVADRCSIDFAAFWLYYGFGLDRDATQAVFARAEAAVADYDLIVVLPWGAIPLVADGVRSTNPWLQLHYQALLEGLLARSAHAHRVVRVPPQVAGLDARIRWICARLKIDQ